MGNAGAFAQTVLFGLPIALSESRDDADTEVG